MNSHRIALALSLALIAPLAPTANAGAASAAAAPAKQSTVVDVAVGSPDHTTLVAAVKAAGLAGTLSSAGPVTVFGPTNAASDALPAGQAKLAANWVMGEVSAALNKDEKSIAESPVQAPALAGLPALAR